MLINTLNVYYSSEFFYWFWTDFKCEWMPLSDYCFFYSLKASYRKVNILPINLHLYVLSLNFHVLFYYLLSKVLSMIKCYLFNFYLFMYSLPLPLCPLTPSGRVILSQQRTIFVALSRVIVLRTQANLEIFF